MSDNGNTPQAPQPIPPWMTLGLPSNWDPNTTFGFGWHKLPGVTYADGGPMYVLILDLPTGRQGLPFSSQGIDNLVKQAHQVHSGLILP